MMWGLIARSERDRGLGIQTKAMHDNLHPDKTLVVVNKKSGFESHPEDYPDATTVQHRNEHGVWKLDEETVRDWWKGLDIVVSVETLYDWRMVEWAKADGVKTIVHGNPEFWMATNPQPDVWWWPTTWRDDHVPYGRIVPVPVPTEAHWKYGANPLDGGKLKVTHVAGSGAMEDRNGTSVVRLAERRLGQTIDFTIHDQKTAPVVDRFDLYRGNSILVLPRRYGGLCLPTLEAMASGLMVIMPDCSPNRDWPPVVLMQCEPGKIVKMQTGQVQLYDTNSNVLISTLRHLDRNRNLVWEHQRRSAEWAQRNTWTMLKEVYHRELDHAHRL